MGAMGDGALDREQSGTPTGLDRFLGAHPLVHTALWVGLMLALLVARIPERFTSPSLFAEEGVLYFQYAWHHAPLDALTHPQLGYYSFWTNLAAVLAAHAVPMESAPHVTLVMGTAVWLLVGAVVNLPGTPLKSPSARLVLVALVLLAPNHSGKLHTSFTHFYLCFATAWVLISSSPTRLARWFQRGTLLVAGTTGALSLFLAPLFAWKWLARGRERETLVQCAILAACGLLQLGVLFAGEEFASERWAGNRPDLFLFAVFERTLLAWFAGPGAMQSFGSWSFELLQAGARPAAYWVALAVSVLALPLALVLIAGPRSSRTPASRALAVAFLLVCVLSFATSVVREGEVKAHLLLKHHRYFVVPCLLLGSGVLLHASAAAATRWRTVYRVLVVWMLAVGVHTFVWGTSERLEGGADWRAEVAAWREDPRRPVNIWPRGARMRLRPAVREKALAGE